MPEYSPLVLLFTGVHLISLTLLSILIYIILRTGPFVTKWTLLQLCICAFILDLSSLLSIIIYRNSLQATSPLCIIQTKIMFFIYYPLEMLPAVLSVYLWFTVARFNYKLEQKFFWHFSGIIWALTILMNIIDVILNRKKENWGIQVGVLFCRENHQDQFYGSIILTFILTITSIVITAHSGYILWGRWCSFNRKQNRRTAINLGYAVRLTVLSAIYSVILIVSLVLTIIAKDSDLRDKFMDFSPSLFGAILFMIFGTTKSAAIFLPCCYYVHPSQSSTPPLPEFIELEGLPDNDEEKQQKTCECVNPDSTGSIDLTDSTDLTDLTDLTNNNAYTCPSL